MLLFVERISSSTLDIEELLCRRKGLSAFALIAAAFVFRLRFRRELAFVTGSEVNGGTQGRPGKLEGIES